MGALRGAVAALGRGGARVAARLRTADVARALTTPEVVEQVLQVLMANAAVQDAAEHGDLSSSDDDDDVDVRAMSDER